MYVYTFRKTVSWLRGMNTAKVTTPSDAWRKATASVIDTATYVIAKQSENGYKIPPEQNAFQSQRTVTFRSGYTRVSHGFGLLRSDNISF